MRGSTAYAVSVFALSACIQAAPASQGNELQKRVMQEPGGPGKPEQPTIQGPDPDPNPGPEPDDPVDPPSGNPNRDDPDPPAPQTLPDSDPNEYQYPRAVGRKFTRFVALGDSYSAGPGASTRRQRDKPGPDPPYFEPTCFQTDAGWPMQLNRSLMTMHNNNEFQFSACTGWDSKQIRENEILHDDSNFLDPDLITLTMGGNNGAAFISVVKACAIGLTLKQSCQAAIDNAVATVKDEKMDIEIADTYSAALMTKRGAHTRRTLLVMGYPRLYEDRTPNAPNCKMNTDQRSQVNNLVTMLNAKLKDHVDWMSAAVSDKPGPSGSDVMWADPNDPAGGDPDIQVPDGRSFDGRRFCQDPDPGAYINGGTPPPLTVDNWNTWGLDYYKGLFHPDANGMRVMADAAQNALSKLPR